MSDDLREKLADREWRIRNLYLILDEDSATVPLVLRHDQEEFARQRANRNFVAKARKLGLSTFIVLDNLDACIFGPDTRAGIIDIAANDAYDKLEIARFAWERGPHHERPEIATLWRLLHRANPLRRDTTSRLEWANGSMMSAGVSYTGKTPQRLHISEYGPISAQFPAKATKIKRGSINSVPPGGIVDIETTMEGGQFGECYHLFKLALKNIGRDVSRLDWKLHFFSWLQHPSYVLAGGKPSHAEVIDYFARIEAEYGIRVPLERQAWYERKKIEQGDEMWQQFPTVIEEVDRLIVPGQIYPEMKRVRVEGRVAKFNPEPHLPMFAAFDLGSSDNMAGWLVQPAGKDHNWLAWCAGEGAGAGGVAEVVRAWERQFSTGIQILVPHDAELTDKGSGKTYVDQLVEAGIPRRSITVVPRIPDIWVGIGEVRRILANCWFHSSTDESIKDAEGTELPSGVQRIEGYRKKLDASTGISRDVPVHDLCSHTADALRTYAEALSRDLVRANVQRPGPRRTVVKSGWRG
jgi:hypothetical protein